MLKIPYDEIVYKIEEKSGLSRSDIQSKVDEKLRQLHGLVSKEGAAHIVANELGVRIFEQISGKLAVKSLLAGMRNVELHGGVTRLFEVREFAKDNRSGKVGSFLLGDETGVVRVVLWNDLATKLHDLKEGVGVAVKGGYVKERNGYKEVHLGDRSSIEVTGEAPVVKAPVDEFVRKPIAEVTEADASVELLGTIVQVFDLKFFEICPQCNKRAKPSESGFFCATHGTVTPTYTAVMNLFLDDGSDTMRIVCFRRQLLRLLNVDDAALLGLKDNPLGFDTHKNELLGSMLKVSGRVVKNPLFDRLEMIASLVFLHPDPGPELERMAEEKRKKEEITNASSGEDVEEPTQSSEEQHLPDDDVVDE